MSGTFGYELDPAKISQEEKEEIRGQIENFKKYYELIQHGDYYRLTSPFDNSCYHAWESAATDGSEALVSVVANHTYPNMAQEVIKLRGLIPEEYYEMNGKSYLGAALMYAGFPMPKPTVEYESFQFHFVKR